jgi:SAM-dependent methyltransferase
VQPHIIHPTTLDAAAQLMIVASTRTGLDRIPTAIPTRVSKLWISGTGLKYSDIGTVLAYSKVLVAGQRHCTCKTVLLDSDMKTVLLDMDIETTKVSAQLEVIDAQSSGQLCYTLTTRPDISLMTKDQLCKVLNSVRPSREPPLDFLRQLECAEIYLMEDALSLINQSRMDSVEPHLRSYLQWMQDRVKEASLEYREPISKSELYSTVEQHDARGRLSVAIGRQLPGILEGTIDPLQTMFGGDLAKEYYELTNRDVLCKEPMIHMLQLLAYKNPKMRILEVGAGTGGATSTILQSLTDCSGKFLFRSYDYTDVSPVFFASAMERFKMYGNSIQFRTLDIEGEIEPQGFEKGRYDIILAGAVLHATKQLDKTLLNARSLLREGGKLILYEMVEHVEREQFIFGLLPGWWLAEDDFRSDGPCINAATWNRALTGAGFSGIDIEIPDYLDLEAHELSIIISTAVHDSKPLARLPKLIIVIAEESVSYHSFARGLQSFTMGNGYESCVIIPLREATTETISTEDHCIFLTDFDRPFLFNMNADSFQALRQLCTTVQSLLWISNGISASTDPLLHRM